MIAAALLGITVGCVRAGFADTGAGAQPVPDGRASGGDVRPSVEAGRDAPPADQGKDSSDNPTDGPSAETGAIDAGARQESACDEPFSSALFCSGFELPDLSDWSFSQVEQGSVATTTSPVCRGSGALVARTTKQGGRAIVVRSLGSTPSTLYFRAYVYLPSAVPLVAANIFHVGDSDDRNQGVDFNIIDGDLPEVYVPASRRTLTSSGSRLPLDRWFCYQARIVISDTAGEVSL